MTFFSFALHKLGTGQIFIFIYVVMSQFQKSDKKHKVKILKSAKKVQTYQNNIPLQGSNYTRRYTCVSYCVLCLVSRSNITTVPT